MKSALLRGELREFGALLDEAWKQKKRMSPLISNPLIDELYELAMRNGALGGKVTGAGGGGYILFYCDFPPSTASPRPWSLRGIGARVLLRHEGLTTWRA